MNVEKIGEEILPQSSAEVRGGGEEREEASC